MQGFAPIASAPNAGSGITQTTSGGGGPSPGVNATAPGVALTATVTITTSIPQTIQYGVIDAPRSRTIYIGGQTFA
jgi:hypothetical protein